MNGDAGSGRPAFTIKKRSTAIYGGVALDKDELAKQRELRLANARAKQQRGLKASEARAQQQAGLKTAAARGAQQRALVAAGPFARKIDPRTGLRKYAGGFNRSVFLAPSPPRGGG